MFVRHLRVAATNPMDLKMDFSEKGIGCWAHALREPEHMVIAPFSFLHRPPSGPAQERWRMAASSPLLVGGIGTVRYSANPES